MAFAFAFQELEILHLDQLEESFQQRGGMIKTSTQLDHATIKRNPVCYLVVCNEELVSRNFRKAAEKPVLY